MNPAASGVPYPPLPLGLAPASLGQDANTNMVHQPVAAAISREPSVLAASSPSVQHAPSPVPGALSGASLSPAGHSPSISPSPRITPEREEEGAISPEPRVQVLPPADDVVSHQPQQTEQPSSRTAAGVSTPPQNMSISVSLANQHVAGEENIYDATPRSMVSAPQQQLHDGAAVATAEEHEPAEPKAAGPSHEVMEHRVAETAPAPAPIPAPVAQQVFVVADPSSAEAAASAAPNGEDPTTTTTAAASKPVDMFEEARRKMLLFGGGEQEEKIPVFPTEPDMSDAAAAAEAARRRQREDEMPQMSATSYPGQEWNPYEHWADDGGEE